MAGYVSRIPDSKRFRLTLKCTDLGLHAIGRADLREIARPILRSLVGEVNEAASLGVLDGADILYIERVRAGITRIGVDIRIGTTIPAFWSTIGEAMLGVSAAARSFSAFSALRRGPASFRHKPMGQERDHAQPAKRARHRLCAARFPISAAACAFWRCRCSTSTIIQCSAERCGAQIQLPSMNSASGRSTRCGAAAKDIARVVQASGTISAAV